MRTTTKNDLPHFELRMNGKRILIREPGPAESLAFGGMIVGVVFTLIVQHFFFADDEPRCEPQQLIAREIEKSKSIELFTPSK